MRKVKICVEGADETPPPPPLDRPGVGRDEANSPVRLRVRRFPPGTPPVTQPPAGHPHAARLGPTAPAPPPPQGPGEPTTGGRPSGRSPRAPSCSSLLSRRAHTRSRSWRPPRPTSTGGCTERRACPASPSRSPRPGMRHTHCCRAGRSPPSVGSTWCGFPGRPPPPPSGPVVVSGVPTLVLVPCICFRKPC